VADRDPPRLPRGIDDAPTYSAAPPALAYRELRTALPTKDDSTFAQTVAKTASAIEEYLKLTADPLSSRPPQEIREQLTHGRDLARKIAQQKRELAKWLRTLDIEVRSYLLGGIRIGPRWRKGHALTEFTAQLEAEAGWMSRRITASFNLAISSVPTTRGRHGNPQLLLLVRWLAKIWEEHTGKPFTRTRKGKILPTDFVIVACQIADKTIPKGTIENAIKEVVRARRGENCRPS
jgi:hypothetical protein